MHKSTSAEALDRGVDLFNRGRYESAKHAGHAALSGPLPETGAHGLVGTCDLYLRPRTPSPLPDLKRSSTYSSSSPRWPASPASSLFYDDSGPEVSREYPDLHPAPAYDEFEYARRLREEQKRQQAEDRLARDHADRERRRREAEYAEAEARAAEEARIAREMEARARQRQAAENDAQRRREQDALDRARQAENERDSAVAELQALQGASLRDRENYNTHQRNLQDRIKDLENRLRQALEELDRERADPRVDIGRVNQLERELDAANAAIHSQRADFDAQRVALLAERDSLSAAHKQLQTQVDVLQVELSRLNNVRSLDKAEHERGLAALKEQHAKEKLGLETDFNVLKDIQRENQNLLRDVDRERNERQHLANEAARLASDRNELDRALRNQDALRQQLSDQLGETQVRLGQAETELNKARDAERLARDEADQLRAEVPRRVADVQDQMRNQQEQHNRSIRQMEADMNRSQDEHNHQMQHLQGELNNSLSRINDLAKQNSDLKQGLADRDKHIDHLQRLADQLHDTENQLAAEKNARARDNHQLNSELADSHKKFDDLCNLLENWKSERLHFDARTDLLITKADRTPSPTKRSPSPYSTPGYSPERMSPNAAFFSPTKSEGAATAL